MATPLITATSPWAAARFPPARSGRETSWSPEGRAERERVQQLQRQQQQTGGSKDIAAQRTRPPAAPIRMRLTGPMLRGSRPANANSTISATTPSAHSTPMVTPSKPFAVQSRVEKP